MVYHFRYDISCFEFQFYTKEFTLTLSIFIPSYRKPTSQYEIRSISATIGPTQSGLWKISMLICRWYFLFIDFQTDKDYSKQENWWFFCYNISYFWIPNGSYEEVVIITGFLYLISVYWNTYPEMPRDLTSVLSNFWMKISIFVSNPA